jgi:hypothetical protein
MCTVFLFIWFLKGTEWQTAAHESNWPACFFVHEASLEHDHDYLFILHGWLIS